MNKLRSEFSSKEPTQGTHANLSLLLLPPKWQTTMTPTALLKKRTSS